MKVKNIIFLALALMLTASCTKHELDPRFVESEEIRLIVEGRNIFSYNERNCQMAYNAGKHEFRVFTDNMSDYYSLRLSSVPKVLNQEVSGEIVWNTEAESGSVYGSAFKAIRLEGGKIWLWDAADGIAVVVSCL